VFTGTGANVLGLRATTESFESIICSQVAHLNVDECAAPENFIGCKLIHVPTEEGKITIKDIEPHLSVLGIEHHAQPKVVSITQTTELGTVYTPEEISSLAGYVHKNDMLLHMDGARLSNAAAALNLGLKDITVDVGVDVLSFGGTKNGMMLGEAVLYFNDRTRRKFKYIRKQGMQLASKMRFISAQFEALLSNELWRKNALHANKMAKILSSELEKIPVLTITQKVEANAVFVSIPMKYIDPIQKHYFFYVWDEKIPVIRLMTSFDTHVEDIHNFINTLKQVIKHGDESF
jgi:threonine aldolase